MTYTYRTSGVCASAIEIEIDDDRVVDVKYFGGCNGNQKGIGALVKGMKVDEAIERLEGITCGFKQTSCPDQLAKALKQIKNK